MTKLLKRSSTPVSTEPLHIRWRPSKLQDVIGHDGTVASLTKLMSSNRIPHAFLFTGPSGTGKTTLARIIASMLGCARKDIIDVDAAMYSGVDMMRDIIKSTSYHSLATNIKFLVVDECHALSKQSWQSLLLATEDTPDHVYWAFCTTEESKIPATIKTRCTAYNLKPVNWETIADFLQHVAKTEKLDIPTKFVELAARQSGGSVRQGLVFLSMLDGVKDKDQANKLLESYEETSEPIELAKLLIFGNPKWNDVVGLLEQMKDSNPESIRIVITTFTSAILLREKNADRVQSMLAVLSAFSTPCNPTDKMAPLLLAAGSLFFN